MQEVTKLLRSKGWLFVDNSGDGGAFRLPHETALWRQVYPGISAGGKGTDDDYLYPVTLVDPADTDVMLVMYQSLDGSPLPTNWAEEGTAPEANIMWETLFRNVPNALDVADWLEANLKV